MPDSYFHIVNQSGYHYQMIWKSIHICVGRRIVKNLVKGDEGWKPQRTANKYLEKQEPLPAIAAVLIMGCWGKKERFRRTISHCKKDSSWCLRSSLPLARENISKENEKMRWEYFKQYHGEICIKKLLLGTEKITWKYHSVLELLSWRKTLS